MLRFGLPGDRGKKKNGVSKEQVNWKTSKKWGLHKTVEGCCAVEGDLFWNPMQCLLTHICSMVVVLLVCTCYLLPLFWRDLARFVLVFAAPALAIAPFSHIGSVAQLILLNLLMSNWCLLLYSCCLPCL